MAIESIRLSNGAMMPLLGLGTTSQRCSDSQFKDIVLDAVDAGYRLFDVIYGCRTELIGDAIQYAIQTRHIDRSEFFISVTIEPYEMFKDPVRKQIDDILHALHADYIDLCMIHDMGKRHLEFYTGIVEAYNARKVRVVGASNCYNVKNIRQLSISGRFIPHVIQNESHIWFQNKEIDEFLMQKNIHLSAWHPLGGVEQKDAMLKDDVVVRLSHKYNVSPAQLILRWQTQKGTTCIPGMSSTQHLQENIKIFDFKLKDIDAAVLDSCDKNIRLDSFKFYD